MAKHGVFDDSQSRTGAATVMNFLNSRERIQGSIDQYWEMIAML